MVLTERQFHAYGPSHWVVLAVSVFGAAGLVALGRRAETRSSRWCGHLLGVLITVLNVGIELWRFRPAQLAQTLPLQLSDLAPYVSAYALWSRRQWAVSLTYYWCLTLSTQALMTPVLSGPDFPSVTFLAFFGDHVLVVWAAVFLTWGLRRSPSWHGYRVTVVVTVCWAAAMFPLNASAGTNYGFLNRKPGTRSLLDLLGPWPWYLIPETVLVLGVWALMTLPWQRHRSAGG
ncbi:MAG TPA: TIGR02206 family membrane protein [Pseudonocardia sp.]|jgi:hypothetical integral membrane protein (TIGR02206 family)|uniref:YwaF family protein n=1 Tax=Pseudonocardia sp. TaxID=60912 RepID=UPI002F3F920F